MTEQRSDSAEVRQDEDEEKERNEQNEESEKQERDQEEDKEEKADKIGLKTTKSYPAKKAREMDEFHDSLLLSQLKFTELSRTKTLSAQGDIWIRLYEHCQRYFPRMRRLKDGIFAPHDAQFIHGKIDSLFEQMLANGVSVKELKQWAKDVEAYRLYLYLNNRVDDLKVD